MNDGSFPFWLMIIAVLAFVGMVGAGLFFFVKALLRNAGGGWSRLREQFPVDGPPQGARVLERQTIQVGSVVYQRCAAVGLAPSGLYLQAMRKKPVLVPWDAIASVQPTKLHWQEAYLLSVGSGAATAVTVKRDLFDALRPFLKNLPARNGLLTTTR